MLHGLVSGISENGKQCVIIHAADAFFKKDFSCVGTHQILDDLLYLGLSQLHLLCRPLQTDALLAICKLYVNLHKCTQIKTRQSNKSPGNKNPQSCCLPLSFFTSSITYTDHCSLLSWSQIRSLKNTLYLTRSVFYHTVGRRGRRTVLSLLSLLLPLVFLLPVVAVV